MNEEILKKIEIAKSNNQKVGLVQGSWDMFHLGHLCYLQEARKLCDFLIVAMDSDEKIRKRKGNKRPIIPLEERYQMIKKLNIADEIVVKEVGEKHWALIKTVRPDVLVAIKENYSDDDIQALQEFCGRVAILPRQSTNSTSDIIRKTLITHGVKMPGKDDDRVHMAVEAFKLRIKYTPDMEEPIPHLVKYLEKSTDFITPVAACYFHDGKWYFGANQIDTSIPIKDIEERSELFYATCEHAEINLLKQLENVDTLDSVFWTTLFPCDKCMKVLINKGVKEVRYLEDHPDKNWSKRSHDLALKQGVKTVNVLNPTKEEIIVSTEDVSTDFENYKYTDPRNVRCREQLDIMLDKEKKNIDPLDPEIIDQPILFTTKHWYISQNRFPYKEINYQFLIASKNPIYKLEDMPIEAWQELYAIWNQLVEEYHLDGGALCFRFGDTVLSGASLKRLHSHLIVPKEGQKTRFAIGGHKVLKKQLPLGNNQENK